MTIKEERRLLPYDAVLFDVDGTLLDSAPGILSTLREVFDAMGTDVSGVDLMRYVGPPLRQTFAEYYDSPAEVERATELYRARMLRRLKDAGLALCTATCKPTHVVRPILEEQGLAPLFDFIAGASMDQSRDTKADVIRHALAQPFMQGRRALMVGDRRDDMQGAAACGLDAAAALYGYGGREELAPFGPVLCAESCQQLADLLLG